jgi:hypothetical protein
MNRHAFQIPVSFLVDFVFISTLGLIGCSSAVPLTSDWKESEIVIDGKQNEWQGSLYDLKKVDVTIGFCNDAENLYLCFISYDQGVGRQIISGGFTVWFDPSGGTNEQYGIKFPIGRPKSGRSQISDKNSEGGNNPPRDFGSGDNVPPMPDNDNSASLSGGGNDEKMMPMLLNAQRELQFLGPEEKDVQLAATLELKTIKVQIGMTRQMFVYELQVPLHRTEDFPFVLAQTDKKNVLGIGFKTDDNPSGGMGGPGGGQGEPPPGGGSGGRPGGSQGGPPPGGGLGGRPGGGQGGFSPDGGRGGKVSNSPESIDIWAKVTLAQSPTAATTK